jgi:NADH pyrophosphatase NudC (nudix superfamily)
MRIQQGSERARWHEVVYVKTSASIESGCGEVTLYLHTDRSKVTALNATESEVRDLIVRLEERLAWIARTPTGSSQERCPSCGSTEVRSAARYGRESGHRFCATCQHLWDPSISLCSVCGEPAHATETDDDDRCATCAGGAA